MDLAEEIEHIVRLTYIYLIFCVFFHAVSDGFYRSTEVGCVWPSRIVLHESGACMEAERPEDTVHVSPPISKCLSVSAVYCLCIKDLFAATMRNWFVITGSQNTFNPRQLAFYQSN